MAFSFKNLVKIPTSQLKVGDLIFGSGGLGEDNSLLDPKIERAEDEYGLSFNLLLRFYRVLKINPSSIWVLDVLERKRYKLAKWYWDGSGELVVKKVPEKYKKEVESELVDSSLQFRLERGKTSPVANLKIIPGDKLFWTYMSEDEDCVKELKYLDWTNKSNKSIHLIIEDVGKLVADCTLFPNPYDENMWWLQSISVRDGYTQKGYASQLLSACFDFISKSPRKILQLSYFTDAGLQKLYPVFERLKSQYPNVELRYDSSDLESGKIPS